MKHVFLVFAFLFSAAAFASTAKVSPAQPIVMTADFRAESGEWIEAPWIRANFTVDASETITITGVKFTVTCKHGYTQSFNWYLPTKGGVEVAGGTSYTLPLGYVHSIGHVGDTDFAIHMDYEGWVGKANAPQARLSLSTDFITQ